MSARDIPTDLARAVELEAAVRLQRLAPPPRVSVAEWAQRFRHIAKGPERGPWRNERTPYLVEPMEAASAHSPYERVALWFATQLGKALALDTPIATPHGWTTMGEIGVGDVVFDQAGQPCNVIGRSPVYDQHACYRVTFSDGAEFVADAGHRWTVDVERDARKRHVATLTTEHIAATFKNGNRNVYAVPVAQPLDLPVAALPIAPYTLGAWLGDGNSASGQITQHVSDAPHMRARIEQDGYDVVQTSNPSAPNVALLKLDMAGLRGGVCLRGHDTAALGAFTDASGAQRRAECHRQFAMHYKRGKPVDAVTRPTFGGRLAALGVLNNKHIPAAYLRASRAQRLELLKGLMDTDGTVCKKSGRVEIASSAPALAAGIVELVRSLGFKPTVAIKKTTAKDSARIGWTAYDDQPVFALPRKLACQRPRAGARASESTRRRIVAVDAVASVPVRCITVDSASHLYLAGREMVPTHNSEVLYNALLQRIHTDPQDLMMVQPTLQDAQDHSQQRFIPTVAQTPALDGLVALRRSRDESTSWRSRSIQGGFTLFFGGANSASSLASKPLGFAVADEVDKWPADVDNEGPPLGLLEERMSNFARRKLLIASTCNIKGLSIIEAEYLASDQRQYHVPCPHCGERQVLLWGAKTDWGLKWLKTEAGKARPETAVYICRHCGGAIDEWRKDAMLRDGVWIPQAPGAGLGKRAGFWLNKLYSPLGWKSWPSLVEEWEQAIEANRTGNSAPLKKFKNSSLAETWEEEGTGADSKSLAARAETYDLGIVPRAGLMLTMGVDTQPDRLEARVWAYGRGEESWLVARHILYGDPNLDEGTEGSPWTRLTEARRTPLMHASGAQMLIEATCIDSGGHNTHAVYNYCRQHAHAHVLAIKGASQYGRPVIGKPSAIDVNWRGRTIARGVKVWQIGTDTAKHLLHGRMRIGQVGPGYVHVPKSLASTDEFDQMTAARLMPATVNGKAVMRWITKPGHREEAGDCQVYAYAAACWLGIQTYREPGWARREAKYSPRDPGLFDAPPAPASAAPPTSPAPAAAPLSRPPATRQW